MFSARHALVIAALAPLALSCVNSEVTQIGTKYPSRPEGCKVDVFPATKPNYPYEDIASSRAKCHFTYGRSACIDKLRADACEAGGTAIYAFSEGVMGEYTMIAATIGRKTKDAPAAPVAAEAVTASSATDRTPAPADGCNPICSPGFACKDSACVPVCNPPCEKGETCTRKRVCEPTATGI
jgi:hypothetical protein